MASTHQTPTAEYDEIAYEAFVVKTATELLHAGDDTPRESAEEICVMYRHQFRVLVPKLTIEQRENAPLVGGGNAIGKNIGGFQY